jgi:hypothetical protein
LPPTHAAGRAVVRDGKLWQVYVMDITERRYRNESDLARNWIDDWHAGLKQTESNATNNADKAFSIASDFSRGP